MIRDLDNIHEIFEKNQEFSILIGAGPEIKDWFSHEAMLLILRDYPLSIS